MLGFDIDLICQRRASLRYAGHQGNEIDDHRAFVFRYAASHCVGIANIDIDHAIRDPLAMVAVYHAAGIAMLKQWAHFRTDLAACAEHDNAIGARHQGALFYQGFEAFFVGSARRHGGSILLISDGDTIALKRLKNVVLYYISTEKT